MFRPRSVSILRASSPVAGLCQTSQRHCQTASISLSHISQQQSVPLASHPHQRRPQISRKDTKHFHTSCWLGSRKSQLSREDGRFQVSSQPQISSCGPNEAYRVLLRSATSPYSLNERHLETKPEDMAKKKRSNTHGGGSSSQGFNPNASSFNPMRGSGQAPGPPGPPAGEQQQPQTGYLPPRLKKKAKQAREEAKAEAKKEFEEINRLEQSLRISQYGEDWVQPQQQQQQQPAAPGGYGFGQSQQQPFNQYGQHAGYYPPSAYGQMGVPYGQPQPPLSGQGQGMFPPSQSAPPPPIDAYGYPVPYANHYPQQFPLPFPQSQAPALDNNNGGGKGNKKNKNKRNNKNDNNSPQPKQPASRPNQPPSRASGGVPEPTEEYLIRSSHAPAPSPVIRPLLVVLDLNGTLLYRPKRKNSHAFIARPFAAEFLTYVIDTFTVVIWSSARPENVSKMCDVLLTPQQQSRVVAMWGREKFGLTKEDYNAKVQVYKRLTKIWRDPAIAASYPGTDGKGWDMSNTVLIDDSAEKARTEPFNCITLPEFSGGDNAASSETGSDGVTEELPVLPMVHEYLNKLAMQTDVSAYIRTWPFNVHDEQLRAQAEYRGDQNGGQQMTF
ncbi:hypothetical protein QBC43DRAFT_320840 [Cladorrhinum sp. PSN259]|nr:hypothetical protein QBC43DRAFT_320840 [Cladorrhinum sp. PSN259]